MTIATALDLGRQAMIVAIGVTAPALFLGLTVGLLVSLMQAVTQIQEPTLAFIPKIAAIATALIFFGPYMLALLTDFTTHIFTVAAHLNH
jgi:flagellar biosynthetic protein FliQ